MPLSRSDQMARIRGKNTEPEKLLRRALWSLGLRYRIHYPTPAGRPDVVFPALKLVIFVDGCFWHGCPDHYVRPKARGTFWAAKLKENVSRDQRQTRKLEETGWIVVRLWEHIIYTNLPAAVQKIELMRAGEWIAEPQVEPRVLRVDSVAGPENMELRTLVDLRDSNWMQRVVRKRSTEKW